MNAQAFDLKSLGNSLNKELGGALKNLEKEMGKDTKKTTNK